MGAELVDMCAGCLQYGVTLTEGYMDSCWIIHSSAIQSCFGSVQNTPDKLKLCAVCSDKLQNAFRFKQLFTNSLNIYHKYISMLDVKKSTLKKLVIPLVNNKKVFSISNNNLNKVHSKSKNLLKSKMKTGNVASKTIHDNVHKFLKSFNTCGSAENINSVTSYNSTCVDLSKKLKVVLRNVYTDKTAQKSCNLSNTSSSSKQPKVLLQNMNTEKTPEKSCNLSNTLPSPSHRYLTVAIKQENFANKVNQSTNNNEKKNKETRTRNIKVNYKDLSLNGFGTVPTPVMKDKSKCCSPSIKSTTPKVKIAAKENGAKDKENSASNSVRNINKHNTECHSAEKQLQKPKTITKLTKLVKTLFQPSSANKNIPQHFHSKDPSIIAASTGSKHVRNVDESEAPVDEPPFIPTYDLSDSEDDCCAVVSANGAAFGDVGTPPPLVAANEKDSVRSFLPLQNGGTNSSDLLLSAAAATTGDNEVSSSAAVVSSSMIGAGKVLTFLPFAKNSRKPSVRKNAAVKNKKRVFGAFGKIKLKSLSAKSKKKMKRSQQQPKNVYADDNKVNNKETISNVHRVLIKRKTDDSNCLDMDEVYVDGAYDASAGRVPMGNFSHEANLNALHTINELVASKLSEIDSEDEQVTPTSHLVKRRSRKKRKKDKKRRRRRDTHANPPTSGSLWPLFEMDNPEIYVGGHHAPSNAADVVVNPFAYSDPNATYMLNPLCYVQAEMEDRQSERGTEEFNFTIPILVENEAQ